MPYKNRCTRKLGVEGLISTKCPITMQYKPSQFRSLKHMIICGLKDCDDKR